MRKGNFACHGVKVAPAEFSRPLGSCDKGRDSSHGTNYPQTCQIPLFSSLALKKTNIVTLSISYIICMCIYIYIIYISTWMSFAIFGGFLTWGYPQLSSFFWIFLERNHDYANHHIFPIMAIIPIVIDIVWNIAYNHS